VTILEIVQDICTEVGVNAPTSVVNSTDPTAKQMAVLLRRAGGDVIDEFAWDVLRKTGIITLVDGQQGYALAEDFNYLENRTFYDISSQWEMYGPESPQEWSLQQWGITASPPRRRYTVEGSSGANVQVSPLPAAGDAGVQLGYKYYSKNWIRPATWASGVSFPNGSYTWYNGNYYYAATGGTSGATPPTHTSGSVSDGGVTWAYYAGVYDRPRADTDVCIIPDIVVYLGTMWRFQQSHGLPYKRAEAEQLKNIKLTMTNERGARTLSLARSNGIPLLSYINIPEGNYGGS